MPSHDIGPAKDAFWPPLPARPSEPRPARRSSAGPTLALLAALAAAVGISAGGSACNGGGDPLSPAAPPDPTTLPEAGTQPACVHPAEGCPCDSDAAKVDCGQVDHKSGDLVTCSIGKRSCIAGLWGACVGDTYKTAYVPEHPASPGLVPQGLAPGSAACTQNPCDPYCNTYNDDATGIDAGADSGLVNDGGLGLAPQIGMPGFPCTGLTTVPASIAVTVTAIAPNGALTVTSNPSPAQFTAQFTPPGCFQGMVPAIWNLDKPGLATISSGGLFSLVSPIPGPIHVFAHAGSWNTMATPGVVNVAVSAVDGSAAPPGYPPAAFQGATIGADSIRVLYPYNNTVLPLGLPSPLIQWDNLGTAANAVKVSLRYPANGSLFNWSAILPESTTAPTPSLPARPRAVIPQNVWAAFEQTAQGNDAVFAIQRITGGNLRPENPPVTLHFATGQLKGTVYYNSYGTNLAHNYCCTQNGANFGAATLAIKPNAVQPQLVVGDDTHCSVCHSVSANGSTLVTDYNNGGYQTTAFNLNNLTSAVMNPNDGRFAWSALSPDGSLLFTNSGWLASANGSVPSGLYTVPAAVPVPTPSLPVMNALTPSFSPDTAHIAFNFNGGVVGGHAADSKSLASIDFNPNTKAFSNFQLLATPGAGGVGAGKIYYPAYTPTSKGVVYHLETVYNGRDLAGTRSQCDQGGSAPCQNEGAHAELWYVDVATKTSVRLNQLNGLNPNGSSYLPAHPGYGARPGVDPLADPTFNYEPTINPQVTGGYAWVVFTTRRLYGNVATVNPFWSDPRFQDISQQPTTKKLWVAAINLNAPPGTDPSYPAFYLQGQELLSGNSRGYWVLDACKPAGAPSPANVCDTDLDCCPAPLGQPAVTCALDQGSQTLRHCVGGGANACVADGQPCSQDITCCGYPNSTCAQGVCKPPPPLISYYEADFSRDYQGTCPNGTHVVWRNFALEALTPGAPPNGASIDLFFQTADTQAALAAAPQLHLGTLTGPQDNSKAFTYFDVNAVIGANPPMISGNYIRVLMKLLPSANHSQSPTLIAWDQQYDCAPSE